MSLFRELEGNVEKMRRAQRKAARRLIRRALGRKLAKTAIDTEWGCRIGPVPLIAVRFMSAEFLQVEGKNDQIRDSLDFYKYVRTNGIDLGSEDDR